MGRPKGSTNKTKPTETKKSNKKNTKNMETDGDGVRESNIEVSLTPKQANDEVRKQRVYWVFTFYNYLEIENNIKNWLISNCKKAVYGHEICPTTNRPHLQGYFELKRKRRLTEIQNKPLTWSYLAPCYADDFANCKYCTKDGNDIFHHPFKRKPVKIIEELRPFQKHLLHILINEPNDRTILWIYDKNGKAGKTQFCKYLIHHYNACYITSGKQGDVLNLVFNHLQNADAEIICLNLPRDNPKIDYNVLEQIKDGLICNTKYETGTILINSPHLIIFSNELPKIEKMTPDRWDVRTIDENFNLIQYDITNEVVL